jgi:xanthine dehydrogenase large subunit
MSQKLSHESVIKHVSGESVYVNDIEVNDSLLFGHIFTSPYAYAKIISRNCERAKALEGVHAVLSYENIPGLNQMGPVIHDEPCLAIDNVEFIGQAIYLIAAETEDIALEAEKLIEIEYKHFQPVVKLKDAIEKNTLIANPRKIETGIVEKAFAESENIIEGELKTGAQEHWYLETQSCLAVPGEGNEMKIFSSTQHPAETQEIVSEVLGVPKNVVRVEVTRLGGAFGGKETQANHYAAWSALLAKTSGRPIKIHLTRKQDQAITGKRHRFLSKYKIGFGNDGIIKAFDVEMNMDAGSATDLSLAILDRALFHIDNAYFIPNLKVVGKAYKTNLPSNTAFRGFGGPQGMAVIENCIDIIARYLKIDPAIVRKRNFYGIENNNITHYGEKIENNRLFKLFDKLLIDSDYKKRLNHINEFNRKNEFIKRGIALTPVKFGISFTTSFLNQAGALVNIYTDGSVLINHGGIEMGQGLFTKINQIAAAELGVSIENIKSSPTDTSKVPNTSATAASSGSDLNGMAVKIAVEKLKSRIAEIAVQHFNKDEKHISLKENICFKENQVFDKEFPKKKISFEKLVSIAYLNRISLSATGFYKTPGINYDSNAGKGNPFHYFAFGMAVSEVEVDTLTGHHEILRTDILHDVGDSLNEEIDIGQIEGGFIQGVGWCTSEEIKWDEKGFLLNNSPDTYKIPTIADIPKDFRVDLLRNVPNPNTIRRSKAVGEPPFMLSFSVWLAIKYAISAVGDHKFEPEFRLPATNELILQSVENIRKKIKLKIF